MSICRAFFGALGRTRTCDLLIRSHSPSQTGRDTGGQGETKQHFYQVLALLEGQVETPGCGQIAVKTWDSEQRALEPEAADGYERYLLGDSVDRGDPLPRVGASRFGHAQNRSERL